MHTTIRMKFAENGGIALFVGTKKQAQDAVKDEANPFRSNIVNIVG